MKKLLILAVILCLLPFVQGCDKTPKNGQREVEKQEEYVQIIAAKEGIEGKCAEYISAFLGEMGYASKISEDPAGDGCIGVVGVGDFEYIGELPFVRCSFDSCDDEEKNTVEPFLTSKSLARAAVLLLPGAQKFSVISEAAGAADVQDACDYFDMSGVDYTVETLDGRPYGDAVLSAAKKGCDGVILASKNSGGVNLDLSEYETAVIAVGEGEPVRGALGTFCIDTEAISLAAAETCVALIEGREPEASLGSYYSFCVSERLAKELGADISAVSEDFSVVIVE